MQATNTTDAWSWTKCTWQKDLTTYRPERMEIEKYVKQGGNPAELARKKRQEYLRDKRKRAALFQWGYALFQHRAKNPDAVLAYHDGLISEFTMIGPQPSYEFARMQVLIALSLTYENPSVFTLGDALAAHDPKDYPLRFVLATKADVTTPEGRHKGMAYGRDIIRLEPNRPSPYGVMGRMHYMSWVTDGKRDVGDLKQAIHYFHEYLKLDRTGSRAALGTRKLLTKLEANLAAEGVRKP